VSEINTIFIEALVPVFFGLGLGYYAGLRGRVDNRNVAALNTTLMHFVLPCSLILGVGRTPPAVLRSQFSLLAVIALAMLAIYGIAFWLERRIFHKTAAEAAVQSLTVAFSNNVAVGLPLLSSLYGAPGLVAVAAAIMAGVLVLSPITLVLLECHAAGAEASFQPLWKRVEPAVLTSLRRPVILAPLCALLLPLTGHALPGIAAHALDLVGKAAVGLALFLTGLILSAQPLRISPGVACGVVLKNIVQPAIVVLLLLLLHLHGDIAREAFLLAAVPAGFFGTVFGARYGVRSHDASSTLLLSTVLSIVTLPAAIALSGYLK
jgi:malonate transporter and related proteins